MKIYVKKNELTEQLLKNGYTSKALANEVNCSETHISNVMNSKNAIGSITARKIMNLLNVPFDSIFEIKKK